MKSITQAFLLTIGTAFAMTACGTTPTSLETPAAMENTISLSLLKDPSLDGKAIFRGIAFGEQTLGQVLPEVWRGGVSVHDLAPSKADRDSSLETVNAFVLKLERFDPTFFPALSKSMRSGNPLTVEAALEQTSKTLEKMFPPEVDPLPTGNVSLRLFIYRNKFIYKNKAVATDRYVKPYKYVTVYKSLLTDDNSSLGQLLNDTNLKSFQQETLIANLTKRLAI